MIERYRTRLSGPLLDRIDLQVEVPRVPHSDLADTRPAEASVVIRGRLEQARDIQQALFPGYGFIATHAWAQAVTGLLPCRNCRAGYSQTGNGQARFLCTYICSA